MVQRQFAGQEMLQMWLRKRPGKDIFFTWFDEVVTQIRQLPEDRNDNEARALADTLPVVAPE